MNFKNMSKSWLCRHQLVAFVALAYGITWGLKLIHVALTADGELPAFNVTLAGQFGPLLAVLLVLPPCYGKDGLKRIGARLLDLRGLWGWLVLAFLFEPVIFLGITAAHKLTGGDMGVPADFSLIQSMGRYLLTFSWGLFFWGLSEEVGWRGYLLPKLQERVTPFTAAIILAVIISFWHWNPQAPGELFVFHEGAYVWGVYPVMVERLLISVPIGFVITWLFNRSNGSLPVMMVFHSASNTSYFWVKGVFGVTGADFFRMGFLIVFWISGLVFGMLLFFHRDNARIVRFTESEGVPGSQADGGIGRQEMQRTSG